MNLRITFAVALASCEPRQPTPVAPEADSDADADSDTDADADADTDADTDSDSDTDTHADTDSDPVFLRELDGVTPNGTWTRALPEATAFPFSVGPDQIEMLSDSGANQHLVRTGLSIAPGRPYRVELIATLTDDHDGLNSFAIHFAVGGADGDGLPISAHTVNLDLSGPAGDGLGTMKWMGFDAGAFAQVGETPVTGVMAMVPYRFVVDVHTDAAGLYAPGLATVTLSEQGTGLVRAQFTGDWGTHPWQPAPGTPVRFGLNGHQADWVVTDLTLAWLD